MAAEGAEFKRIVCLQENGRNYTAWKFQIKIILKNAKVFEIVERTFTDEDKPADFENNDLKAQNVIITSVCEKTITQLVSCKTAAEMWSRIEALYGTANSANIHALQQQFYAYTYKGNGIANHISELENLSHSLSTCGEAVSECMLLNKILSTLPVQYKHFHSAWDSTATKDLNTLTSRLLVEEQRLTNDTVSEQVEGAFAVKKFDKKYHKKLQSNKKNDACNYCKKLGHWEKDCWFKKNKNSKNKKDSSSSHAFTSLATNEFSENWYLDTGASHHMTGNMDWFDKYVPKASANYVTIGNGDKLNVVGEGIININVHNKSSTSSGTIENVLHVPQLKCNLFSASAAADKGFIIVTRRDICEIIKNNEVVMIGKREQNLFKLNIEVTSNKAAYFSSRGPLTLETWHKMLAHQNIVYCKNILKNHDIKVSTSNLHCESCIMSKQHRTPFPSSTTITTKPGEIIHMDLCGPMEQASIGGSKYFFLLKDDFSHYRNVYFLKSKTEVTAILDEYVRKFKTETDAKVRIMRSDNGTEFKSQHIKRVLDRYGIRQQFTTPYNPEQNGSAERENRTIVEAAKALLYDNKMDKKFWAESVHTAVYVLNRTGTSSVEAKTPFELYFGKQPRIDDLKLFGSEVFIHIPAVKRLKWDVKSKPGIFVGYSLESKGYRVYIPNENKIEISRDVIFKPSKQDPVVVQMKTNDFCTQTNNDSNSEVVLNPNVVNDMSVLRLADEEINENEVSHEAVQNDVESQSTNINYEQSNRRSLRNRNEIQLPKRLQKDYLMSHDEMYSSFLACDEPLSYDEAKRHSQWKDAMENEMQALLKNETWELVELPKERKALNNKWVFRIKSNNFYKARLVAKGYNQTFGIDYNETFSPVAQYKSIRFIIGWAAQYKMKMVQFDVKTAFLNGELHEEVYMLQPEGYDDGTNRVCKLKKGIYGLKQASRNWNAMFVQTLKEFNLVQSEVDPCVFIKNGNDILILVIYVDDGLIISKSELEIEQLLTHLESKFEIKREDLTMYLGMQIDREKSGSIKITQKKYIENLLKKLKMENCKAVSTPGPTFDLSVGNNSPCKAPYRETIGSLLFLASVARPDIAFTVNQLSRYNENPNNDHWEGVKRLLRYLQGTKEYGLTFEAVEKCDVDFVQAYSDSDFAGDSESRRSTSGYVIMMNGTAIDWFSKRQSVVALSTAEAEFIAATEAIKQAIVMRRFCQEFGVADYPITINMDNQSAMRMIEDEGARKRTKHIDVRCKFLQEKLGKEYQLKFVDSKHQLADILTKPLSKGSFEFIRSLLNIKKEGVLK